MRFDLSDDEWALQEPLCRRDDSARVLVIASRLLKKHPIGVL